VAHSDEGHVRMEYGEEANRVARCPQAQDPGGYGTEGCTCMLLELASFWRETPFLQENLSWQ